jgi:hypothetical protein
MPIAVGFIPMNINISPKWNISPIIIMEYHGISTSIDHLQGKSTPKINKNIISSLPIPTSTFTHPKSNKNNSNIRQLPTNP